jgi:putative phosphoribosyl transferase
MQTRLHEIENFRDQRLIFADRFEAGATLGSMLQSEYSNIEDGMILAIPSGGVPVGLRVKEKLGLPLELMIVRKLQIPGNTEAGFGAMTLDGTVFFNETLLAQLRLSPEKVESEKRRVVSELKKRNTLFRGGRSFPDLTGKTVVLVDDGLASGYTMLASVEMAKKVNARKIIVAIPTAPLRSIDLILSKADKVYCANIRSAPYFAVAEAYRNWYDLDENEVMGLMNP